MNPNQLKLSAIAAAVAAAFAAPAGAVVINGAGASAINNTLKNVIVNDYCASPALITIYDDGTSAAAGSNASGGSGVYRVVCTPSAGTKFTAGLDVSYDTTGGSWKGLAATNANLVNNTTANPFPFLTIDNSNTASCTGSFTGSASNITVWYGCPHLTVTTQPQFGFTDVSRDLFINEPANQPLVNGSWNTGQTPTALFGSTFSAGAEFTGFGAGYPGFGVVFGIAASKNLYNALQTDQIGAGPFPLPSTCSGVAWTAGGNACTPSITRSQYRSIVGALSGASPNGLNFNASGLFISAPADTTLELARRDQGSGSQASSNAYFLDKGCSGVGDLAPALPSDIVAGLEQIAINYLATTGKVLAEVNAPTSVVGTVTVTSGFVIGVASAENDSASKLTGGAGFLRLDGVYPSNSNATAGYYGYVTTENFHCTPGLTGDAATLCKDLAGKNGTAGVPVADTLAGYSGTGIVKFTASNYSNANNVCAGWRKYQ